MTIANQSQLENTRNKLKLLEDQCASLKSQPSEEHKYWDVLGLT